MSTIRISALTETTGFAGTDILPIVDDPGMANGTKKITMSNLIAGLSANPTASAGLTAVNGSASTFMRSDGAPKLSQAIAPTWTGIHKFTKDVAFGPVNSSYALTDTENFPQLGMANGIMTSVPVPINSKLPFLYDSLHKSIQWYDTDSAVWHSTREFFPHTETDDGTVAFSLAYGSAYITITQHTTFSTLEKRIGRQMFCKITAGPGGPYNLTWPGTWRWLGSAPATIAASKIGLLELWCFGPADSDVLARWSVET